MIMIENNLWRKLNFTQNVLLKAWMFDFAL